MSPTPQELQLGADAYRQVRMYENNLKDFRQKPWVYVVSVGLVILAVGLGHSFKREDSFLFVFAPIVLTSLWWQNRLGKVHYAQQKLLLHLLEEKYGDALPWVVEEKLLGQARKLDEAIAESLKAIPA